MSRILPGPYTQQDADGFLAELRAIRQRENNYRSLDGQLTEQDGHDIKTHLESLHAEMHQAHEEDHRYLEQDGGNVATTTTKPIRANSSRLPRCCTAAWHGVGRIQYAALGQSLWPTIGVSLARGASRATLTREHALNFLLRQARCL
jgi:hypothetical protein